MNYIPEYLEKMKSIQQNILEYINDEDDSEDKFQNINDLITKNKIDDTKDEFKTFLYSLTKISNNHQRSANFFSKIERILESLKNDLLKFFSNSELFHIFGSNKRILLFLIETKIFIIDESIAKRIIQGKYLKAKYPQYFQPEIQPFIKKKWFPKYNKKEENEWILEIEKEIPAYFYELRKNGENDHFICELIRKDSIEDFIVYMNQNNYKSNSTIKPSNYETNNFLLKKQNEDGDEKENENENPTIIEYSAFFGSIQIFNYLLNNGVELTTSLWYYGIHGNNAEIIQILEDNQIKPLENESFKEILKESIKCHHNEIADYIQNNYLVKEKEEEETKYEVVNGIKYRNFKFINNEQMNETTFNYLCEYDYYTLVSILLNKTNIDINHKTIYKIIHFNSIFNI